MPNHAPKLGVWGHSDSKIYAMSKQHI